MKAIILTQFSDLGLNAILQANLSAEGYVRPTPIQARAIPEILAGHDILGIAQTGTGKTAGFALPLLHRLATNTRPPVKKSCRAVILSPTRELASQIAQSFRTYGKGLNMSVAVVFGGVPAGQQIRTMAFGVDILVATPGRLLDLLQQGALRLDHVEYFVLDEADQMLDMGFIHAIRKLIRALPQKRQSLFFSATMPKEIAGLAGELLRHPTEVAVTPVSTPVERITQSVVFVDYQEKRFLLSRLLAEKEFERILVFARTKHGADRIVRHLENEGVMTAAIHGNKSQGQRERALNAFRSGQMKVLIATDIAARGIDIDGISHVVNFDLPNIPESYVHRIGRTARAGNSGCAISFCAPDEWPFLRDIEKLIRMRLETSEVQSAPRLTPAPVRHQQPPAHRHERGRSAAPRRAAH